MKPKIVTIIGARPQFIKAAVLSRKIKDSGAAEEILIHTGQHYDQNLSEIFFHEMNIPVPNYQLSLGNLSHGSMTGRMLEKIEGILLDEKPDIVNVYGDTNSTLAGALAASKLHIPISHIEAGLRSFNMKMPEEINRRLTDHLSAWLFCPSNTAVENLKNEGISSNIHQVGDIMFDAVLYYSELKSLFQIPVKKPYYLVTIHREENTNDIEKFTAIIDAFNEIATSNSLLFPAHPRTKKLLDNLNIGLHENIHILDPLGYIDLLYVLKNSSGVLTDSGGLQKEAYFLKRPCITLRDETEWIETVHIGVNYITGAYKEKILESFFKIGNTTLDFSSLLYGSGNTGEQILHSLLNEYK